VTVFIPASSADSFWI